MSFDNDNPVSAAAAAPAVESHAEEVKPEVTAAHSESEAPATPAPAEAPAAAPAPDAEAVAAAEEAAGAEEMSKLMAEYDEQQEAHAQNEILAVKVVAYTEHGVVVDLGMKTEGLIPAAEFADMEIPRPDPNATIEVQRTGEKKDGYTMSAIKKCCAAALGKSWKLPSKRRKRSRAKSSIASRVASWLTLAFAPSCRVRNTICAQRKIWTRWPPGGSGSHHEAEPPPRQYRRQPSRAA